MDASLNISLPQSVKEWLERRAAEAGFDTTGKVVEDLVRREQEREQQSRLEAHLHGVLNGPPATPMTKAHWQRIRENGLRRLEQERNK